MGKTNPVTLGQAKRLRRHQTPAEDVLWRKLRARRFKGIKFKRQVPIGPYIVDFFCNEMNLIIEVDGCVHELKKQRDEEREKYIRNIRYRVLRFTNLQVLESLDWVLGRIGEAMGFSYEEDKE